MRKRLQKYYIRDVWPLKKLYFHGVWAAIETVRLGFAFYMITDNDLKVKADSLISHTCN